MQPTFKQVPPSEPRFSIQETWYYLSACHFAEAPSLFANLQAGLSCFDSCDISRNTAADDD
jgi:hypothetical protein